jgi:hypothetical protein
MQPALLTNTLESPSPYIQVLTRTNSNSGSRQLLLVGARGSLLSSCRMTQMALILKLLNGASLTPLIQ